MEARGGGVERPRFGVGARAGLARGFPVGLGELARKFGEVDRDLVVGFEEASSRVILWAWVACAFLGAGPWVDI